MLIKTPELFDHFIEQLEYVCFQKDIYETDMKRINNYNTNEYKSKVYEGGFGNQPFSKIMFVGSFFKKKFGAHLSDIDVTEWIDDPFDEKFVQRFQDIIKNLNNSSFIYMRFFCGEDPTLIPPWHIDGKGSCNFNLERTQEWFEEMQRSEYLDNKIKNFLNEKLNNDTISVRNLLDVEEEMKKYNSISWKADDILNGYVDFHGKRYNLLDTLKNYDKKKTLRYVFKYKNKQQNDDMLLIDYSIRQKSKQIEEGSLESRAYYLEDPIKIIKMYKRWIQPRYNEKYDNILNETTRKYTTIAFRLDMIMRIRRYGLINESILQNLESDINQYISGQAKAWKNTLIDDCKANAERIKNNADDFNDFLVNRENIDDIYSNIQVLLGSEAKKGVKEMEAENMVDYKNIEQIEIYKLRAVEVQNKISKDILNQRALLNYSCPFFTVDLEDLKTLYKKGLKSLVDPVKLLRCLYQVSGNLNIEPRILIKVIFSKEKYSIVKLGDYKFFKIVKKKGWQVISSNIFRLNSPGDYFNNRTRYVSLIFKDGFILENIKNYEYLLYSDKTNKLFNKKDLLKIQKDIIFTTDEEMKNNLKEIEMV